MKPLPTLLITLCVPLFWTGCIESDSHFCSWGAVCPPGTVCSERYQGCVGQDVVTCSFGPCAHPAQVCDEAHRQCIFPIQRSLCEGEADGTFCAPPDTSDLHRCYEGVCLRPYCGDGMVDGPGPLVAISNAATATTGETCDDGNFDSGDGCSGTCRVEAGWDCDGSEPTRCTAGPLRFAPGKVVTLPPEVGQERTLQDVHHTAAGALLVTYEGPGGDMDCFIARSEDQGATWQMQNLGRVDQDTARPRLWPLGGDDLALTAYETFSPKDVHLRLSTDGGLSFGDWIRITDYTPGAVNGSGVTSVVHTPGGTWIVAYTREHGIYSKRSEVVTADGWRSATERTIYDVEYRIEPALAVDGGDVLLAITDGAGTIEVSRSVDEGRSFDLQSVIQSALSLRPKRFYNNPATGVLYLCATGNASTGDNGTVRLFRSHDGGLTWDGGVVYLSGIAQLRGTYLACALDDTGVYVAYQDPVDERVHVILPGPPSRCGNQVQEPGEVCDGSDLAGVTCLDFGFGGGELACTADCQGILDTACLPADNPPSCEFVDVPFDRQYVVDPDGLGPNPPFAVYCADMDTPSPRAYLPLTVSDATHNSSRYVYTTPETEVRCQYTKVHFESLRALTIDGTDQRFATCFGNGSYSASAQWGQASSCTLGDSGTMNIDLTGTPFAVDLQGGVSWTAMGYLPEGGWSANADGTVVDATGFGYCGSTAPTSPPGLRLRFR